MIKIFNIWDKIKKAYTNGFELNFIQKKIGISAVLILILGTLGVSTGLSGCDDACTAITKSAEKVLNQMTVEYSKAQNEFDSARWGDPEGSENRRKLVPTESPELGKYVALTAKPLLDDFYELRRIWLTIKADNSACFDAADVAKAKIELKNY